VATFIVLAGVVCGMWTFLRAQERAVTAAAIEVAADQTARNVEDYLARRQMAVSQLAVFWDAGTPLPAPDFVAAAQRIAMQFPGIQSINLVRADGTIAAVAPVAGNRQALGYDIHSNPGGEAVLAKAAATGRWVAGSPFELVQGGRGFAALLPIGRDSGHPAYLQLVFRLDTLLHRIWRISDPDGVFLAIADGGVPVMQVGARAANGPVTERSVTVADREWRIMLAPAPAPLLRMAYAVPLFVGLAGAAFIAWLVGQALRRNAVLKASEKRFREYAEATSDWFWEIDRAGRLTFLSASAGAILAKPVAEYLGRPMAVLMADLRIDSPTGEPIPADGVPRTSAGTAIHRLRLPDGRCLMLLARWHAMRGPDGEFLGYRGAVADLRRDTAAHDRAVVAEHRLQHAIRSVSEGFALFDDHQRLVLCNDRYLSYLPAVVRPRVVPGLSHDELVRILDECGAFDDTGWKAETWRELFQTGAQTVDFHSPRGPWLHISYGRTDEDGCVVIITDITELKKREAAVRDSEERYRSLVDGSIQGMLVYRDGRVLFANRTATTMLGFRCPADIVVRGDLSLLGFLSPDQGGRPNPLLAELAPGEVRDVEIEEARLDGEPLWLVVRARRVAWHGGPATQMTVFDGTSHKQIERSLLAAKEQAEDASRAKSTFLAQMSHELRTPLNAVIGFSEVLHQEMLGPLGNPRYREYADDIAESGRHLLAVINDILDVAKFEAGRLTLQESRISLADIIQSSLRMLHERAAAADIVLDQVLPNALPLVRGDHSKVKQILLNLLSNALKFTPAGGRITVAAACEGDGALSVSVRDTGIGMAAHEIPRALEPFTQVGASPEIGQQGTGLGLPLAKAFTQLHGGRLVVESAPGCGTCVTFRLPRERILWEKAA
jgi:PAS domain S-box-containing protein